MATSGKTDRMISNNTLKVRSLDFGEFEEIPEKYYYDRENIIPRFEVVNAPFDATSLAFAVIDEDAPGRTMVHCIVWDIDPKVQVINEQTATEAIVGKNSWFDYEYHGPTPLKKRHHYSFNFYAIRGQLDQLDPSGDVDQNLRTLESHALEKTRVLGFVNSAKDFAIE